MTARLFGCRALLWALVGPALLAACATPAVNQTSPLEGRWRNTGATLHLSTGSTIGPTAMCWVEFSGSRSISECVSSGSRDRIVSTYRIVAPGVLESEVIENKKFPKIIGARSRIEFRIENGTLFTTAFPAPPTPLPNTYPVKIDATWVRE